MCPECGYKKGDLPEKPYYLHPGTVLANRYIVGTACGSGGFGTTYRVWDTKLECVLAIKEYYPNQKAVRIPGTLEVRLTSAKNLDEFEEEKRWFLDEARNMAKFSSHPNIINVFDFFEENGTAYIVMEYLEGLSLKEYLKKYEHRLNNQDTIEITMGVINALKTVHKEKIIHRDICPANIFLCVGGGVKLIDFGSARFSDNSDLMRKQTTVTVGYAPCEQYNKKEPQGIWNDIYALGATMYKMLTGERPDESTNRKRSYEESKKDTVVSPIELVPSVTKNLSNIVMKAMAIDYGIRFKDVYQLEKALVGKIKVKTLSKEKKSKLKKKFFGFVAAALVFTVGAVSLYRYVEKKSNESVVPNGTISFVYVKDENEWKEEVYSDIIKNFEETYNGVKIELKGISENELKKELSSGSFSGVFENVIFDINEISGSLLNVGDIFNSSVCSGVVLEEIVSGNKYNAPLGFYLPVLYVNTTLEKNPDETVNWDEIKEKGLVIDNDNRLKNIVPFNDCYKDTAIEDFKKGQIPYYLSTSCNYSEIEMALPSQIKVISVVEDLNFKDFSLSLSSINSNDDSEKISKAFIEYFVGEKAQDIIHIQNESGYFPINEKSREIYEDIRPELEDIIKKIVD